MMARYSAFLGHRVEVQYRAGDILLPASGMFVADSGRSIFLEQSIEQRGQHKHFRWEIPYQYLVRIEAMPDSGTPVDAGSAPAAKASAPKTAPAPEPVEEPNNAASAAAVGASSLHAGAHRPKPA
jgi:hypothetical protein